MTIDELKQKLVDNTLERGVFTAGNKIVEIYANGFDIKTPQDNGWIRINSYQYFRDDDTWVESETYE